MYNSSMKIACANDNHLEWAHPLVKSWFLSKFKTASPPQIAGWPPILNHEPVLISAPTGSGKTLAAFLACLDSLVRKAIANTLTDQTEVLYVSPLKALSNDIHKNLTQPLAEIMKLAKAQGITVHKEVRVAVRTGDTLAHERQAMLKKPPHILVTTPESLYILLTADKSRAMLQTVKTVIVDEIHAIADDKRGAHLILSLARLDALCHQTHHHTPARIGLSATQKPIERVAQFFFAAKQKSQQKPKQKSKHKSKQKLKQKPVIINIGHQRALDLEVVVPASELGAVASNEMWDEIYNQIVEYARTHQSILVFVNTRRLSERVAHHLAEQLGEDQVAAHHGSLSRKIRFAAESKLKNGELKVLVATASLELGIDIGAIDLVCQIGSPRAIATALQRVGRAGHFRDAVSKGRFFATTRDELLECAALIYAIKKGDLDQLIIPEQPLDILAQQIVATCATGDWHEDDLFNLLRNTNTYANLSRETFNDILTMLADGIAGSRGRYGAYLLRDRVHSIVKARRGARLTAIMNGGAIPENGLFTVIAEPHEIMVGTLDEDFAIESNRGDIILLGTTSWRIKRVESALGRVRVEDAHGAPPTVPFWRGEAPGRTQELSAYVAQLREQISQSIDAQTTTDNPTQQEIDWLHQQCGLDEMAAAQLIEYIQQGRAVLGAVPTQNTIIAERFFDESGGMQLVIHAPFGARINKAWGLALRKCFCRSFNFELQAQATDDGLNIALAEQHSFPLADVFHFLHPNSIKKVLTQAVLQSPLFNTRWRWVATRSLALPRFRFAKKIPPNILRMLADDLLAAVFPDAAACQDNLGGRDIELPDHPLIYETMKDALSEAMDIDGLIDLLKRIEHEEIKCIAIDTPIASPFSHEILNANPYAYLDDAPLEERRARAVEMRRVLPETVLETVGQLDPAVIAEVKRQAWPDIRNADELHDVLQTFIALPQEANWQVWFEELAAQKRAYRANDFGPNASKQEFWLAAEKAKTFAMIYPHAIINNLPREFSFEEQTPPSYEAAVMGMLRGWLQHLGPTTARELSEILLIEEKTVEQILLQIESTGMILRGQFRGASGASNSIIEWCERRLLARIHKQTLGKLRKEIEPVTAAEFITWLLHWQHVAPGTQLRGERGLMEILKQLQGFEIPANAWEQQIFAKRVSDYNKEMLDHLCMSGAVGWGRLSKLLETPVPNKKRIVPTSVAPITFFIRDDAAWLTEAQELNHQTSEQQITNLSAIAKQIFQFLKQRGASFLTDIQRELSQHHLKAEIETGLWELVASGLVTADGFDNLRALIDPKRRLRKTRRRTAFTFSLGRWSLLHHEDDKPRDAQKHAEAVCWMLLKRYGVVFRDLITREKNVLRWRELLVAFRRLEDRGEIRGGRFVSGFLGEQFALPYAVESLRAMRKANRQMSAAVAKTLTISAVDPINLVGIILPGERIPAHSGHEVKLDILERQESNGARFALDRDQVQRE